MIRTYEGLVIFRPNITEDKVDEFLAQVRELVASDGGSLDEVDRWGVRSLAYEIEHLREGYYLIFRFRSSPQHIKELERRIRVNDNIIRHLTLRLDEKLKKLEKIRRKREARAARKPQVQAPLPGQPQEEAAEQEPASSGAEAST